MQPVNHGFTGTFKFLNKQPIFGGWNLEVNQGNGGWNLEVNQGNGGWNLEVNQGNGGWNLEVNQGNGGWNLEVNQGNGWNWNLEVGSPTVSQLNQPFGRWGLRTRAAWFVGIRRRCWSLGN